MVLRRDDTGALAIIVALFAVALFILGAMVVEAGGQREARADAQNAADASVLAAAQKLFATGNPARAVREAAIYGAENNFPPGSTRGSYFNGCTAEVPTGWIPSRQTSCVAVHPAVAGAPVPFDGVRVVTPAVSTTSLFGAVTTPTRALAQADIAQTFNSTPVIFGRSGTCPDTVSWGRVDITGDVHSNSSMSVGRGTVTGQGTYVTSVSGAGSTIWDPSQNNPDQSSFAADPVSFDVTDYRPGGIHDAGPGTYVNAGNETIDRAWLRDPAHRRLFRNTLRSGIYYTTGDIDITGTLRSGSSGTTFISDGGTVSFSDSTTLRPFVDNLVVLASGDEQCDSSLVTFDGSMTFAGFVYAPSGPILVVDDATVRSTGGSLIGETVQAEDPTTLTLSELPPTVSGSADIHLTR